MGQDTHPDYSRCEWADPASGDQCECGGVRHWHAKTPLGCDDCSCAEFRLAVPYGARLAAASAEIERLRDELNAADGRTYEYRKAAEAAEISAIREETSDD
jgi:hypothetical protein